MLGAARTNQCLQPVQVRRYVIFCVLSSAQKNPFFFHFHPLGKELSHHHPSTTMMNNDRRNRRSSRCSCSSSSSDNSTSTIVCNSTQRRRSNNNTNMLLSSSARSGTMMIMITMIVVLCSLPSSTLAFSSLSMMAYKPPVKSSVSKLGTNRYRTPEKRGTSHQQQATFISTPQELEASSDASSTSDSSRTPSSFQDRMRNMLGTRERQQERQRTAQRRLPSNVHEATTLQAFKELVVEHSDDSTSPKLIAVRFYAPWCKACQAVKPLFYRMANQFPNVVFVDVPVSNDNANLHQGLGVPSLPYGHIYHPSTGLVEESRLTKKHVSNFARTLQSYVRGSCELKAVGDAVDPSLEA